MDKLVKKHVHAIAATTTLSRQYSGSLITNRGATGAIVITLPPGEKDLHVKFLAVVDFDITVNPQDADTITDTDGTALAAGAYQKIDDLGGQLEYVHDGSSWLHVYERGTITNE